MKENENLEGNCTIDSANDLIHKYVFKCNKPPFATITVKVCSAGNRDDAKVIAELEIENLTEAPANNVINVDCQE